MFVFLCRLAQAMFVVFIGVICAAVASVTLDYPLPPIAIPVVVLLTVGVCSALVVPILILQDVITDEKKGR